uniref:Uncharacterized protein n=1 Tax=Cacopsylla melanoneura TaxID=428564 RepID=A0A8D8W0E3_9HEMI
MGSTIDPCGSSTRREDIPPCDPDPNSSLKTLPLQHRQLQPRRHQLQHSNNSNSSSRDNSCCMKTRPTSLFRVEQRQCRILSPRLWNWGVSFSSSLIWCKNRRKWLRG